jgi:hypothetical protein
MAQPRDVALQGRGEGLGTRGQGLAVSGLGLYLGQPVAVTKSPALRR